MFESGFFSSFGNKIFYSRLTLHQAIPFELRLFSSRQLGSIDAPLLSELTSFAIRTVEDVTLPFAPVYTPTRQGQFSTIQLWLA